MQRQHTLHRMSDCVYWGARELIHFNDSACLQSWVTAVCPNDTLPCRRRTKTKTTSKTRSLNSRVRSPLTTDRRCSPQRDSVTMTGDDTRCWDVCSHYTRRTVRRSPSPSTPTTRSFRWCRLGTMAAWVAERFCTNFWHFSTWKVRIRATGLLNTAQKLRSVSHAESCFLR